MFKTTTLAAAAIASATAFAAPTLTVGYSDIDSGDLSAKLTWEGSGQVTVQRAESSDGPWSDKGTSSIGTWTDSSTVVSKTYWYRLNDGSSTSDAVKFAAVRKLDLASASIVYEGDFTSQGWCKPPERAFDGSIGRDSYPDANVSNPKAGVDLGSTEWHVAYARAYPRVTDKCQGRLNGLVVYGIDSGFTADGTTWTGTGTALSTALSGVADDKWYPIDIDPTSAYRCFYYSGAYGGNVTELELYGWTEDDIADAGGESGEGSATAKDADLAVASVADDDFTAKLSWTALSGAVMLQASYSATGPWADLANIAAGTATYTDTTAPCGITRYYRLSDADGESGVVSFKRLRRFAASQGTVFWTGVCSEDWYKEGSRAFDGDTSTFPDLNGNAPKVGVDFGELEPFVSVVRVHTRPDYYSNRSNGALVYGSSRTASALSSTADSDVDTALSVALSGIGDNVDAWYDIAVDSANAYRTFYLTTANGNLAEIQFYGWTAEDIAAAEGVATPVVASVTADPDEAEIAVAWTCETDAEITEFVVERRKGSGSWTELARPASDVFSYVDVDPETRQTYFYRLTAIYANGFARTSESSEGVYYKKTMPDVALTIPEIANVVVKSVKADGQKIEGSNGVYMIPQGSEVEVTFLPAEGYILNRTTMTFTVEEAMTLPETGRPSAVEGVPLVVNEVMAANETTLSTHDGATEIDWIEIRNLGGSDVDIAGWLMTDDPTKKISKWKPIEGPAVVPAGGYLIVFADNVKTEWSEFDAHVALGLSSGGECAALASPDGTVISQLAFGQQFDDVSFGVGHVERELVRSTRAAEYRIGDGAWKSCEGAIGMAPVVGAFKVDVYGAKNCSCDSLERAKTIVNDPDSWSWFHTTETKQTIAYFHAYNGTHMTFAPYSDFQAPDGWDGNNIAVHATAVVNIPEPGYWTFSMYGDQWFEYTISGHGAKFTKSGGGYNSQTVDAYYFSVAGDYEVEIFLGHQGGDAGMDFSVAKGELTSFSTDNFHLVGSAASGVLHSGSIASKIYTRVDSEMLGSKTSASWRKSFTLGTIPDDGEIQLRICYADGFEASINNHVFRSVAVASRTDEEILAPSYFNIPVEYLNIGENTLEVVGYNSDINDQTFLIASDVILNTESGLVYFTTPTPGRENASDGKTGMTPKIVFSEPHGYKTESFQLSLSCPEDDGVKIYYTLDGSSPTTDSFLYTAPITVSKTTVVRAAAADEKSVFQQDSSATYLFLADVLSAPQGYEWDQVPPGWPSNGSMHPDGSHYGASMFYGMNQTLVANERARIEKGFTNSVNVATISMVVNLGDLFDNSMGIWANAGQHGSDWERPAMIEQIDPVTGEANEFSVSCGVRMRGGMSRGLGYEKHGFRLFFRSEYGMSRLEFPLFGEDGASSFKKIDLRCDQNHSFAQGKGNDPVSGMYDTLVHEVFNRDSQLDMGQPAARSRYYHLFINGVYYGLYQTEERCEDEFAESYLGGAAENYDVIKTSSEYSYDDNAAHYTTGANEGTIDAWSNLWHIAVNEGFGTSHPENYNKVLGLNADGTRNLDYPILLNRKNLQDYVIETHYAADCDSPGSVFGEHANNLIAIRNRVDGEASKDGFLFFRHDSEYTLGIHDDGAFGNGWNDYRAAHVSTYGTSYSGSGSSGNAVFATLGNFTPTELHYRLMEDPEYRMSFADRVYKHCFKDGALTVAKSRARFERRMAEVEDAASCEIARWAHKGQTHTTWENACNYCLDFIDKRIPYLIADYQERGWYPTVPAPLVVDENGDAVYDEDILPEGSTVHFDGEGDIYYVTDGTDPRAEGGGIAPGAIKYDGNPIAITIAEFKIRARILKNGEWSPLENVNINSQADNAGELAANLRFHSFCGTPAVPDGDTGEWIAVTNLSTSAELDLSGIVIIVKKDSVTKEEAKCRFTIPNGTTLPANGYLRFDQAEYGWNKITNNKIDMYIMQKDGETEIQKAHATQKDFPTVYGNVGDVGGKGGGAYLIATSFEVEIDKTCWVASPVELPELPALADGTVVGTVEGTVATIDASLAPAGTEVFIPEGVTEVHISVKDSDSASVDTTSCYTSASLVPAGGKIVPALDESVVRPAFTESAPGMKDAIKVGASTVELMTSAKPGLFYMLKSSSSVRGEYAAVEKRQAASGDNFVAFSVQRPAGASAFYVVEVTDR
jgi:hypothetical protein